MKSFSKKNTLSRASRTTGGLGHSESELITEAPSFDQASLTENLSDELTQEHLDKLISMQMVYDIFDGNLSQEKFLYFQKDGTVFKLTAVDIA